MNEQPSASVPPLLTALRRRHPDVDVVLLEERRGPMPQPVGDAAVARVVESLGRTAADLAGDDPVGPVRLAYGPEPGTVVARSRTSGRRADGAAELSGLRARLERDGWRVRRLEGDVTRVVARLDGLQLRASYASETGFWLLELSSSPLRVGEERARALVGRP
jgi:hypothetical protein